MWDAHPMKLQTLGLVKLIISILLLLLNFTTIIATTSCAAAASTTTAAAAKNTTRNMGKEFHQKSQAHFCSMLLATILTLTTISAPTTTQ